MQSCICTDQLCLFEVGKEYIFIATKVLGIIRQVLSVVCEGGTIDCHLESFRRIYQRCGSGIGNQRFRKTGE